MDHKPTTKYFYLSQSLTHRYSLSQRLADLYTQAETATNRKDCIKLINTATKLEEQINAGQTIHATKNSND